MSYELRKVNKDPADFEGMEPDVEHRLEFCEGRSNKFWRIWVYGSYIVRHWGRHGTKGQMSTHKAWNDWGARGAASDLYDKKYYGKGYRPEVGVLDRIAREIGE